MKELLLKTLRKLNSQHNLGVSEDVIAMAVNKKIIIDHNVENLIPLLQNLNISKVWDITKLGLDINADDNDIANKLNTLSTPNSAYLFITENAKDFQRLLTKNFDILIVSEPNPKLALALKFWLFSFPKGPSGKILKMVKTRGEPNAGYNVEDVLKSTKDTPSIIKRKK